MLLALDASEAPIPWSLHSQWSWLGTSSSCIAQPKHSLFAIRAAKMAPFNCRPASTAGRSVAAREDRASRGPLDLEGPDPSGVRRGEQSARGRGRCLPLGGVGGGRTLRAPGGYRRPE